MTAVTQRDIESLPPAAAEFLDELRVQRRMSLHTLDAYRRDLDALRAASGSLPLERIGPTDVRRFIARMHASGLSAASLARRLSAWRSFYRWLGQNGRVASNPADAVRAPKRAKRLPKALAPDQAVQLAAHSTDG